MVSCGKGVYTNQEFLSYVQRFQEKTKATVNVPITFKKQEGFVVGVCYRIDGKPDSIEIDPDFWNESKTKEKGDEIREALLFHELGHCVLNQDHREEMTYHPLFNYAFPNSLMYPYLIGGTDFYSLFKEHYVEELLTPGKRLTF